MALDLIAVQLQTCGDGPVRVSSMMLLTASEIQHLGPKGSHVI